MTEQELKGIEKRLAEANEMYSEEAMLPYKQRFPCADCVFRCTDIPNLIKANRDKDKEIERLRGLVNKKCSCGAIIDHDYCKKCLKDWES